MKPLLIATIAMAMLPLVRRASGQLTFSFDENGNGTLLTTSGVSSPVPMTLIPGAPPVYHLGYKSTAGDALVFELPTSNTPSDLLRFDNQGNVTVYSDFETVDVADLADVRTFPTLQSVVTNVLETSPNGGPALEGGVNGLFGYRPAHGSGLPGAPRGSAPPVTINFTSDVPEPSTAMIFCGAALALLVRRRKPVDGYPPNLSVHQHPFQKEKVMKSLVISSIALIVVLSVRSVSGQTFTFDENGKGTVITTAGGTVAIPVSTTPAPLTYHLGYASTPGDILLTEGTSANTSSDLLRFDNQGNVTVFSDLEPTEPSPDLADVTALPPPITPFATLPETDPSGGAGLEGGINGLFGYSPAPGSGLPGAPIVGGGPVTLNFISDVPEPSSWALIILAAGLGLLIRRRRPIA
jgi:hypothetical protein